MKVEIETTFVYKSICHVDTDAVDRLNNRYTTIALVACFLIIAGKVYVGNPINCWGPGKFRNLILTWVKGVKSRLSPTSSTFSSNLDNDSIHVIQPVLTSSQRSMRFNFSILPEPDRSFAFCSYCT